MKAQDASFVFFRRGELAFFMYGFAKNRRDNLKADELADYKALAAFYLKLSHEQINALIESHALIEVRI